MKTQRIGKVCTSIFFGVLLGVLLQHQLVNRRQMTRADFLAKQATRYDREIKKPTPFSLTLIASILTTSVLFGTYELIIVGISKLSDKTDLQA